jgi:hypothetical protein
MPDAHATQTEALERFPEARVHYRDPYSLFRKRDTTLTRVGCGVSHHRRYSFRQKNAALTPPTFSAALRP